jgi:hypothetical protein
MQKIALNVKKVFAASYSLSGRFKEDLKRKIALGLPVWLWNCDGFKFFLLSILNGFYKIMVCVSMCVCVL